MKRYVHLIAIVTVMLAVLSSCAAGGEGPAAVTDWKSGVKTDWSVLTPYEPPEEIYTRLSEGPLPELMTRADYGPLLPYVGARAYGYGDSNLYGFITLDGTIVTDAAYPLIDLVERGEMPVYRMIKSPENDTETGWHPADTYGVCAYDGGWATPCVYSGVLCLDRVIILIRDLQTNDADVIDYQGTYLYSLKDTAYFDELLPGLLADFFYVYGDGLLSVLLADWSAVLLDQRTGARIDTGFGYTGAYSEGLAPVTSVSDGTMPYGYVDRSFSLVIEPRFYEPGEFLGGKAVVRDENGDYLIIDKTGAVLLRTTGYIERRGPGLFRVTGENGERWLDKDLKEITFRPGFDGDVAALDGWYSYNTAEEETILSDFVHEYVLPGALWVTSVKDGFVEYRSADNFDGVMRLDGTEIVEADNPYTSIQTVEKKNAGVVFTVNQYDGDWPEYELLDINGRAVLEGQGTILYNAEADLFQITADDFFGYCDETGRFVFKISLLKWLPD